ncbi:MAG: hypothetical protein L0211_12140 [Planctomycetaceae bacterium]|nr:hypothetical protein [Planctomycetaceae bacterium]
MLSPRIWTIVAMILAAAATRLVPHPPNMTAVFAMALFGGACFHRRWLALFVPLAAMLLSDIVLSLTIYAEYGFSWAPVTYVCMALTVALGMLLRDRVNVGRVTLAAIVAGVMFFLISNFSVWLGGKTYPQNLGGLVLCYVAGLPFALNTIAGNLLYSGILFGGLEGLQRFWPSLRESKALVAATGQ